MAVLAAVMLVFGLAGCGDAENGPASGGGVLVKIENFPGTLGQISVHSSKPASVVDTNNHILAAGGFYGGSTTSGPLASGIGYWKGGTGYIVIYAGSDHYVSKAAYTLTDGTNTINFTGNFDPLTGGGDPNKDNFSGMLTITPAGPVITNTKLTAQYSGTETVIKIWQWMKRNTDLITAEKIGTNSNEYTPSEAGFYFVIMSAEGYNDKTSADVVVNNPGGGNNPAYEIIGTWGIAADEQTDIIINTDGTGFVYDMKATIDGNTITIAIGGYTGSATATVSGGQLSITSPTGDMAAAFAPYVLLSPFDDLSGGDLTPDDPASYEAWETQDMHGSVMDEVFIFDDHNEFVTYRRDGTPPEDDWYKDKEGTYNITPDGKTLHLYVGGSLYASYSYSIVGAPNNLRLRLTDSEGWLIYTNMDFIP